MACEVVGCERPVNRDGVCFPHKLKTVGWTGGYRMKMEREGGYTQADIKKEIFAEAKRTGTDIRKAGVTSPTSGGLIV